MKNIFSFVSNAAREDIYKEVIWNETNTPTVEIGFRLAKFFRVPWIRGIEGIAWDIVFDDFFASWSFQRHLVNGMLTANI